MRESYALYYKDTFLGICLNEADAQEMILALTEEYVYDSFLRENDNCGLDIALWVFQNAPKYGWDTFYYKIETTHIFYY